VKIIGSFSRASKPALVCKLEHITPKIWMIIPLEAMKRLLNEREPQQQENDKLKKSYNYNFKDITKLWRRRNTIDSTCHRHRGTQQRIAANLAGCLTPSAYATQAVLLNARRYSVESMLIHWSNCRWVLQTSCWYWMVQCKEFEVASLRSVWHTNR
jgi:hypothetical protein